MPDRSAVMLGRLPIAVQRADDGLWELAVALTTAANAALGNAVAVAGATIANDEAVLLGSAVRATTQNLPDTVNTTQARGIALILDVTAVTALQTLTLDIQIKDPASGKYLSIVSTGALGTTATLVGTYGLMLYPGLTAIAALLTTLFVSGMALPYTWRARVVHSGAGNFTYSLGRTYLR